MKLAQETLSKVKKWWKKRSRFEKIFFLLNFVYKLCGAVISFSDMIPSILDFFYNLLKIPGFF